MAISSRNGRIRSLSHIIQRAGKLCKLSSINLNQFTSSFNWISFNSTLHKRKSRLWCSSKGELRHFRLRRIWWMDLQCDFEFFFNFNMVGSLVSYFIYIESKTNEWYFDINILRMVDLCFLWGQWQTWRGCCHIVQCFLSWIDLQS